MIEIIEPWQNAYPFVLSAVRSATSEWPDEAWPHWLVYQNALEQKSTCCEWSKIPLACAKLLCGLASALHGRPLLRNATADLSLYGAGLHSMWNGGFLSTHLDADRHPTYGLRREANAILFLNEEWPESWGGRLLFYDCERRTVLNEIHPSFGRLVLFRSDSTSFHAVEKVTAPPGVARKSLAMYFWGFPTRTSERPRSKFVSVFGELATPEMEALRQQRSAAAVGGANDQK